MKAEELRKGNIITMTNDCWCELFKYFDDEEIRSHANYKIKYQWSGGPVSL